MPAAAPVLFQLYVGLDEYACTVCQLACEAGRITNWKSGLAQPDAVAVNVIRVPENCGGAGAALSDAEAQRGDAAADPAWYEPAAVCRPDSSTASNWAAGMVFSSLTIWLPAVVPHQSSVVPPKNQSAPLSARTMP